MDKIYYYYELMMKSKELYENSISDKNNFIDYIYNEKLKYTSSLYINMYDNLYESKIYIYDKNILDSEIKFYNSIIEYINITYDINDISYILGDYKDRFINYILNDIKNIFKDNIILEKLFNNYINNLDYSSINLNILGPRYYKYYSNDNFVVNSVNYGKLNIYIYGETHFQEIKDKKSLLPYIHFSKYLKLILENSASFNDVYVEDTKESSNLSIISQTYYDDVLKTLEELNNTFKECDTFLADKNIKKWNLSEKDKCNLFRYHYVNIRVLNIEENIDLYNIFKLLYETVIYGEYIENFEYIIELLIKKLKILIENGFEKDNENLYINRITDNFYDFFINDILNDSLLQKELSKSYIGNDILIFIKNEIKLLINKFIYEESISEDYESKFLYNIYSIYNIIKDRNFTIYQLNEDDMFINLFYKIMPLYNYKMDCYTLSRIFKVFDVKDDEKQPIYPKNIHIYTGTTHSETYSKFINENLNFNLINDILMDYDNNYINLTINLPKDVIENFKKEYDGLDYDEYKILEQFKDIDF